MSGPKLLVIDIETAPLVGYAWGIWQQNISAMEQIIEHPYMLCYGARWHGTKKVHFQSEYHDGRTEMLVGLKALMDEADFIVGWNSARFDRTWINAEMDKEGLGLPAPARDIDLMRVAKKNLKLPSYKLDYVAQHHYGLPGKVAHQGFKLWRDVMHGEPHVKEKAWRDMKRYQIGDIKVTDAVLDHMKPMVTVLPNPALFGPDGEPEGCGCKSTHLQRRGWAYTNTGRYRRYQCQDCGAWLKGKKRDRGIDLRRIG